MRRKANRDGVESGVVRADPKGDPGRGLLGPRAGDQTQGSPRNAASGSGVRAPPPRSASSAIPVEGSRPGSLKSAARRNCRIRRCVTKCGGPGGTRSMSRPAAGSRFIPQEHAPGAEAQVEVVLNGVKTTCRMFDSRLSGSARASHRIYPTQAQAAFVATSRPLMFWVASRPLIPTSVYCAHIDRLGCIKPTWRPAGGEDAVCAPSA